MKPQDVVAAQTKITGHADRVETGRVQGQPLKLLEISEGDLPLEVKFGERRYVILRARSGGLFMNGR